MKSFKEFSEEVMGAGGVAAANKTGDSPNMSLPPTAKSVSHVRRKFRQFNVESATFRKFQTGRSKFSRWSKFLNLNDETHREIYEYAKKNRDHVLVLRDSETGALRAIRKTSSNGS